LPHRRRTPSNLSGSARHAGNATHATPTRSRPGSSGSTLITPNRLVARAAIPYRHRTDEQERLDHDRHPQASIRPRSATDAGQPDENPTIHYKRRPHSIMRTGHCVTQRHARVRDNLEGMPLTAAETHSPAVDTQLVQRVRELIESAQEKGEPRPGRPALVKTTGAKDHEVRKALFVLSLVEAPAGDVRDGPTGQQRHPAGASVQTSRDGVVVAGDIVTGEADTCGASPGASGDDLLPKRAPGCHGSDEVTDAAGRSASELAPTATLSSSSAEPVPSVVAPTQATLMARLIVWGGFLLGLTASVLANVLDTWLPAAHQPVGWSPGLAPQIGAAVWPAALMFAVETLSRVPWPGGTWWLVARYGGAGTVALGSAVISYGHVHDVLSSWGYGPGSAALGPLVIDGLMVICGFALLALTHIGAVQQAVSAGARATTPALDTAPASRL
jgi:hypothetical protein